jgi:hypothetical protein
LPNWGIDLGAECSDRSRPSRRPTPFFDGIAGWWPASGRMCPSVAGVPDYRRTSARWWFGWRRTIRPGATRGSRCPEGSWPSCRSFNDRAHPPDTPHPSSGAPHDVEDIRASALAGADHRRLLHD